MYRKMLGNLCEQRQKTEQKKAVLFKANQKDLMCKSYCIIILYYRLQTSLKQIYILIVKYFNKQQLQMESIYSLTKNNFDFIKEDQLSQGLDQQELFPLNSIGTISIMFMIQNENSIPQMEISYGSLVSSCLVITSSKKFISFDQNSHTIKNKIPLSFMLQYFDEKDKQIISKSYKINEFKINPTFVHIFFQNEMLKIKYQNEKDVNLKLRYNKEILSKSFEAIKYDFALLKLQIPIKKQKCFKLFKNFNDKNSRQFLDIKIKIYLIKILCLPILQLVTLLRKNPYYLILKLAKVRPSFILQKIINTEE